MRTVIRTIAVLLISASLMLAAAAPALAARHLGYRGETSEGRRVRLEVLRKPDGRRFLTEFFFIAKLTCEDASTTTVGFGHGGKHLLDENGQVTVERREDGLFGYAVTFTATVRRDSAEGTAEIVTSGLTSDDQAQLCVTPLLDWSAERVRRAGAPTHHAEGLVRIR